MPGEKRLRYNRPKTPSWKCIHQGGRLIGTAVYIPPRQGRVCSPSGGSESGQAADKAVQSAEGTTLQGKPRPLLGYEEHGSRRSAEVDA